jgi:2-polyprenyl-3-methyl-5-hydroxy-6-metoxy-1,4-benzoquinol methylase
MEFSFRTSASQPEDVKAFMAGLPEHDRDELLKLNEQQGQFYESPAGQRGNLATSFWRKMRGKMHRTRNAIGIGSFVYQLHSQWLGDLSHKRVLDLGCYEGNAMSLPLAKGSESYLGIDLSAPAIERLKARLQTEGFKNADARKVDFLDPGFADSGFDVVYAHAVAHHFKYFETFLQVLFSKLTRDGIVITLDPLQTSLPVRLARAVYRPFQSDRDWEWPFTKHTFEEIQRHFEIVTIQGVMGYAKWCLPLSFVSQELATRVGRTLHAKDVEEANALGSGLWRCMQVTMCWRRR